MLLDLLFAAYVVVVTPLRAWRAYRRHAPPASTARYLTETLLRIAILCALLYRHGVPPAALGLRWVSPGKMLLDLAVGLVVIVGPDAISAWRIVRRTRHAAALPEPEGLAADALAGRQALRPFAAVTIAGAVWEELCFRATVLLLVPPTVTGYTMGVLGGSLLFGAQHLRHGWHGLVYSSAFGLLFWLVYLATGNLAAVIVAHAAGNFLTAAHWAPLIERARREAQRRQAPLFLG